MTAATLDTDREEAVRLLWQAVVVLARFPDDSPEQGVGFAVLSAVAGLLLPAGEGVAS